MKRTQIDLPDALWRQLNSISRMESVSIAELIRRAVALAYPPKKQTKFEEALDSVTGMWKDRRDIDSTESYVRSLRQSNRLERIAA